MTHQEVEDLIHGPAPDRSECRAIPRDELGSDECDAVVARVTGDVELHCGASNVDGFVVCRFHLFYALHGGYTRTKLRTENQGYEGAE
ncbi:hypothetical protein [Nocardiopsis nanhaiensis]